MMGPRREALRPDELVFPKPAKLTCHPGELRLEGVRLSPAGFPKAERAAANLFGDPNGKTLLAFSRRQPKEVRGPEAYRLKVTDRGLEIEASDDAGAFYAVQTLRQLLPLDSPQYGILPCMEVDDRPIFSWRGFMLDVSRHLFSVEHIKGLIDWLAFHKLNIFHWHLTDDGGWRLESKAFPDLTRHGAWRARRDGRWDYFDITFPGADSGVPVYGGFYSHEEVRDLVSYANERCVTIVPEIDVPGHALAACASYPELTCTPEAAKVFVNTTRMMAPNVLCAGKTSTYEFLEQLIDEVVDLFPSEVIHLGGDEVDHTLWRNCRHCQERMLTEGLHTESQLHGYFVRRVASTLKQRGRTLMGWDEILNEELVQGAMVMSWRGSEGGRLAARKGHDVVMTPTKHSYFDYSYQVLPSETAYAFDPVEGLSESHHPFVKGGQANLWTEYVPTWQEVERRTFPRLAGLAEALWTGPGNSDELARRMPAYLDRLDEMGIVYEGSTRALQPASYQEGVLYLNR